MADGALSVTETSGEHAERNARKFYVFPTYNSAFTHRPQPHSSYIRVQLPSNIPRSVVRPQFRSLIAILLSVLAPR